MNVVELLIRFLQWCARKTPPRVITGRNGIDPYLTRYFLSRHAMRTEGMDRHDPRAPKWGLYLHYFHRSDDDGELHSHPWSWAISLVLKGGYSEERRVGDAVRRRVVRPGRLNVLRGESFHRVDLLRPKIGAWSLFLVGPVTGSWGFWNRETLKFTPWREFLGVAES